MKTTKEWFETLDEEYRDKALKNMTSPNAKHFSLLGAISNGFNWKNSLEGSNYWKKVFREIKTGVKQDDELIEDSTTQTTIQSQIEKPSLIQEYKSQVSKQEKTEEPKLIDAKVETVEAKIVEKEDKETPPPTPVNYVPRVDKHPLMDAYKKQQEVGIKIEKEEVVTEKN
jgi:hypothetical protein